MQQPGNGLPGCCGRCTPDRAVSPGAVSDVDGKAYRTGRNTARLRAVSFPAGCAAAPIELGRGSMPTHPPAFATLQQKGAE